MRSTIRSFYVVITLLLATNIINAQTKTIDLERFDGLSVAGNIDLILIPDSENFAEIKVEDIDMDKLEIRKKGNTLKINLKNKGFLSLFGGGGKAYIKLHYTEDLETINSSASADITSDDIVHSDELSIGASSGSSIDIEVTCNSIDASISSGADVDLVGSIDEQEVVASSGGSYRAHDVKSKNVKANASSGGTIKVWATDNLKGRASSGGIVQYKGNPSHTDASSSSGGRVKGNNQSGTQ